jgi:hypothetical protein
MADLSWRWIAVMLLVPPPLALAVAWPLWQQRYAILGNLVGTAVIFVAAIAMIFREYVQIDRATRACLDAGFTCWPEPSAFARYAMYAGIALVEVFVLFTYSLRVERKIRDRGYAPEWR